MIIVGYVRSHLTLNLEAILVGRAIFLQKISSGHQNVVSASGLCKAEICKEVGSPLVQDSMQYSNRICNQCSRKIRNLGQLYQFMKAAITSTASTPVKSVLLPRRTKPVQRNSKSVRINSPASKSPSIEGST